MASDERLQRWMLLAISTDHLCRKGKDRVEHEFTLRPAASSFSIQVPQEPWSIIAPVVVEARRVAVASRGVADP
jgi:hypothetical protein